MGSCETAGWDRTSYRRSSLANWLTDPRDGAGHLAARVIVNRLWQHHFGVGIVPTASDFGNRETSQRIRKLLDWLAVDLIQHGWKLKRMHRLMMTSSVYMQSSDVNGVKEGEGRLKADRENQLLWRFNPRRWKRKPFVTLCWLFPGNWIRPCMGPGLLIPI